MTVNTLTLYMPGSSVGIQVYEGSQLHLILVSMGANSIPSAPGETVRQDPFPQYVDDNELATALSGLGGGGAVESVNGQTGAVALDFETPAGAQAKADAAAAASEPLTVNGKRAVREDELAVNVRDYGAVGDGGTPDNAAIQAALTGGNKVVYFPAGDYLINAALRLYANTRIIMHPDCVLLNNNLTNEMVFVNGQLGNTTYAAGYGGDGNIWVSGGQIDNGPRAGKSQTSEAFAFGHAENVLVENVRMRNNYQSHFIELNAVRNGVVRGCTFTNLNPAGATTREAINIDSASQAGFPQFGSYDDTMCQDVLIESCTFDGVQDGVGGHAPTPAHRNIRVRDCVFTNLTGVGVHAKGWIGGGVSNCRVDGVTAQAMYLENATDFQVVGNELRNAGTEANATYAVVHIAGGAGCYAGRNRISSTHANKYAYPYDVDAGGVSHRIDTVGADLGTAARVAQNDGTLTVIDGAVVAILADDTAIGIPLPGTTLQGLVLVSMQSTATHAPRGMFWARTDSTPTLVSIASAAAADLVLTTGVLTGTTGTDVKFTMSAANDGKMYLENRTGVSRRVAVSFLLG